MQEIEDYLLGVEKFAVVTIEVGLLLSDEILDQIRGHFTAEEICALREMDPPEPVECRALIDTGSSATGIPATVRDRLGLLPVGVANAGNFAVGDGTTEIYAATVTVGDSLSWRKVFIGESRNPEYYDAILGTDVIGSFEFEWNVPRGKFALRIP